MSDRIQPKSIASTIKCARTTLTHSADLVVFVYAERCRCGDGDLFFYPPCSNFRTVSETSVLRVVSALGRVRAVCVWGRVCCSRDRMPLCVSFYSNLNLTDGMELRWRAEESINEQWKSKWRRRSNLPGLFTYSVRWAPGKARVCVCVCERAISRNFKRTFFIVFRFVVLCGVTFSVGLPRRSSSVQRNKLSTREANFVSSTKQNK